MAQYKLKSKSLVPPGGFSFCEPATGARFDGGGFEDTVRRVVQHRQANNLPRATREEVAEDIENQLCQRLGTDFCDNITVQGWGLGLTFDKLEGGTRAIVSSIGHALTGKPVWTAQEVAERRAGACAKCFLNRKAEGCLGCGVAAAIQQVVVEVAPAKETTQDAKLQSCGICGCALQVMVHVADSIMVEKTTAAQREAYAEVDGCWVRDLL